MNAAQVEAATVAQPGRLVAYWDGRAATYDQKMATAERRYFTDSRRWVCRRASGATLELAVGTGLNFAHYDDGVDLTAVDWSPRMVAAAELNAARAGRSVAVSRADAMSLPFDDDHFDSVVCTFSLCCIPDERAALREAIRVLRPSGSLLLADHIVASNLAVRIAQHLVELVSIPLQGEHYTRRPLDAVRQLGLTIVASERLTYGAIERIHAVKPTSTA